MTNLLFLAQMMILVLIASFLLASVLELIRFCLSWLLARGICSMAKTISRKEVANHNGEAGLWLPPPRWKCILYKIFGRTAPDRWVRYRD